MPITKVDLERRVGPRTVAELLDDDGDGQADAALVSWVIGEARAIGHGILKKGFADEAQRNALEDNDPAVAGAFVDIAVGIMGRRRSDLGGAASGSPYSSWRKEGEAVLERIASGERRAAGEEHASVGRNAHVVTSITRSPTPQSPFIFLNGRRGGGRIPGGF